MPANLNVGELLTSTLDQYKSEIIDNVINNNALLSRLKEKGSIQKISGGNNIVEKIAYAPNLTVKFQNEYDILDTTPQNVIDQASYSVRIMTGTMTVSKKELLQNSGPEQIVSLVKERKKNLVTSLQNKMASAIFGDGTSDSGKAIGGLQLLVADTPTTGVVGGIDRAANTFWRNQSYTLSSPSASNIQDGMNTTLLLCQKFINRVPDLIVADGVYYGYFLKSLQTIQRIVSDGQKASLGFTMLDYQGSSVTYDMNAPANHMYFLNTDFLFLKYLGNDLFAADETKTPFNQTTYNTAMLFHGNLTMSQARVHAVMK